MLRRELLQVLLVTPLARRLTRWPPFAAADGPDAAVIYREAFAWARTLQSEDVTVLRDEVMTMAIDGPRAGAFIRDGGPALKAIREAASVSQCRWEPGDISVDDLNKGRLGVSNLNIVRIACLSARRHASMGRGREALDDLFAALTLAHRVGAGGVLLARLLESGGECMALQTLGRILPRLDRATMGELSRRLEALPPPEPASATIGPESRFILGSLRAKIVAGGAVIDGEGWEEFPLNEEETAALRALTGGDRGKLLAHLDASVPAFAELARRLDLPRPDCRKALDDFARTERPLHPLAASLVESAWRNRHLVDRMRALRAMLHAGLVLVRDGEAAFRAESDPFGTGAFGLERRGDGYLIRSALNDEPRPEVSLAIGEPS